MSGCRPSASSRRAWAVENRMVKVTVVNLLDGEERPRGRSARHQVQNRYLGYTLAANFVKGGVYGIAAPSWNWRKVSHSPWQRGKGDSLTPSTGGRVRRPGDTFSLKEELVMKQLKSKFFAVLLVCVLAAMSCASRSEAIEVYVSNYSMQPMYFAFAREGAGNDTTTRGWYKVDMRTERAIQVPFDYDPDDYYFWYATSGGKRWSGKDFTGWIHPTEAFKSEGGRRIPRGKQVGFRQLKVSKNGKAKFLFQ